MRNEGKSIIKKYTLVGCSRRRRVYTVINKKSREISRIWKIILLHDFKNILLYLVIYLYTYINRNSYYLYIIIILYGNLVIVMLIINYK